MIFAVRLTPATEQDLAAAWLAASDRVAVTEAAHRLEQKLASDPLHTGESRASHVSRVDFEYPLGFTFDVIVDDATVFITAIWLTN